MPNPPKSVSVRVPGKINLHLGIGGVRPDGYHELVTVFHAVDLVDEVVATRAAPGAGLSLRVLDAELRADEQGSALTGVPADHRNLAWQAAALVARHAGVPADARLELCKRIPVAGGMAGGSADAAGALLACARLWQLPFDLPTLTDLAAQIGSDVAFPLLGGTAVGTGRGEVLSPVPSPAPLHWVLAVSPTGLSTSAVYAELDRLRASGAAPAPLGPPDALLVALAAGGSHDIAANLGNDLQVAAVSMAPQLADTLASGLRLGALAGVVSGSGPTCAFLCADAASASAVAAGLAAGGSCRAAAAVRGSAAGAQVLPC